MHICIKREREREIITLLTGPPLEERRGLGLDHDGALGRRNHNSSNNMFIHIINSIYM